ncbi:NUDIX hydrolase [Candidatus Pacebacteria bacterium]|nr:NUDIX hydrolase [Candidatus Paceibacterota bacterium]
MRTYIPPTAVLVPEHASKVFTGVIFDVYQWEQEQLDGSFKTFEMIKRPDTVNIIPVHNGKIILGKETQPYTGTFISIPAGMHDEEGEDELAAAKRELREETGYVFKNWKLVEARQLSSNKIEQLVYTFIATDLDEIVEQNLDAGGEKIEIVEMSLEEMQSQKHDPIMRFYPHSIFGDLQTLEDLLALPSLHDYGN